MRLGKVLCFGEILLRFSPDAGGSWLQHHSLPTYEGGAECNVAHALALWGIPVSYLSAMPDNFLSASIIGHLHGKGIETSSILLKGNRMGLFFLQQGLDMKNQEVIYDRSGSSFACLHPGEINWDNVLKGISWFHFSAISPALSENAALVCKEALDAASAKGITISVDLNYRAKLWQYGKQPNEVMPELVSYADLVMGNIWAAHALLATPLRPELIGQGQKDGYLEHSSVTSLQILEAYPKCKAVANTFRFTEHGNGALYYATLHCQGRAFASPTLCTPHVADTVGSGDCLMAGLIYGFQRSMPYQEIINYAASAAFGKLHVKGDVTTQRVEEINTMIERYAS